MPYLDDGQWEEFSQNGHLVSAFLRKDGDNPQVSFNAYNLAVYEELEEELED